MVVFVDESGDPCRGALVLPIYNYSTGLVFEGAKPHLRDAVALTYVGRPFE